MAKLVEEYLARLAVPPELEGIPPHIASLIGIAKGADPDDYKRHLLRKYR